LNVLAGSAQSLAATDDPHFAWVKGSFRSLDPRIPLYDISAAKKA
jgi:5-deoxy-glucuronate isomerase